MNCASIEIGKILLGGIVGALIGGYFAHCLANRRDAANLKRECRKRLIRFRGSLNKFRCLLFRSIDLEKDYTAIAPEIAFECGLVADDISDCPGMVVLCKEADSFRAEKYKGSQNSESRENVLTKHLDEMINGSSTLLAALGK